ncbi:hypothetical protein GGR92_004491 [Spirosoma lacussanchae]|uniref:hypothetical protein n=1 Tax=Spirosoma lacussanchae TaxID=1884249 RepID=UPI001107AE09|nr:hypothetical protein [Spirosoma lacussanchae]
MNATRKQLTPAAVRLAATTLILAEGYTTTLCVKQFLRNRGYRAYQAEVSQWLLVIASQQGWSVHDNGLFRVYYFPRLPLLPQ